jgi:S-DNA-T family DNA segregation ATPase FtsK/SpoIIIE
MGKKKGEKETGRNKKNDDEKTKEPLLKKETRSSVLGIVFFVLAIFFMFAPAGIAGIAGTFMYGELTKLLGFGFFLLPILFVLLGVSFMRALEHDLALRSIVGSLLFVFSGLGIFALLPGEASGGFLGKMVAYPLLKLFDIYISTIFLFAFLGISLLFIFDTAARREHFFFLNFFRVLLPKKKPLENTAVQMQTLPLENEAPKIAAPEEKPLPKNEDGEGGEKEKKGFFGSLKKKSEEEIFDEKISHAKEALFLKNFVPPPISLLEKDRGKPGSGDVKGNLNIIKRTLQQFGINVEMDEVSVGPSVTRYALKPAEGVKLARIVGLQNELALNLEAYPVRIEAPIPGTSLVGIEVPNSAKTTVGLASTLSAPEFSESPLPLLVSLGKSISGKSHFGNVAKMPHLLVAGTTGSGKSVMVHTMITSLLYRNPPENLRFILIDPKRVELTLYNGIPHLLTPVITDAKKAIQSLRWAAGEMDRRYDVLEAEKVRDIQSYHKNVFGEYMKKNPETGVPDTAPADTESEIENIAGRPERLPYIVIIIDELADIMQAYPRELEAAIVRLAQMSRAVGIHLILSTQRPSVNVITGLIKANIPSRIALQVSSQIDSRTILDTGGAEKLLGAGDMLYLSGEMSKPLRMQSAFVSEGEVKKVVKYLVDYYRDMPPQEINLTDLPNKNALFSASLEDDAGGDDDLYEDAREEVIRSGKASTSYLQRKLGVGYARAAKMIDMMEERGVVGPANGSKAREVLIKGDGTIGEKNSESDI